MDGGKRMDGDREIPGDLPIVFLAFANNSARPLPRLGDECRELTRILGESPHCELIVQPYATASDVIRVLTDDRCRNRLAIFHYAGHAGGDQLLLEGTGGKTAA